MCDSKQGRLAGLQKLVQKTKHWSGYWADGNLTSLPEDFAANYDGEIAHFWHAQFAQAPEGGKLLDLCTGNGAIALLAAAWFRSQSKQVELYGVDAARIDPQAIAGKYPELAHLLPSVTLIDNCPVENIDLPGGEYDLITSQYGIEYCHWRQAAEQVFRLLKAGGRFAFLSHAVSTDIIAYMEAEWSEYELLDDLEFLATIRSYLRGELDFPEFQLLMQKTLAAVSAQYRKSRSPFMATLLDMLTSVVAMSKVALEQNHDRLDGFQREIGHGRDRLEDLLRVNRAIQSDPGWYRVFERQGLGLVDSGDILYRGVHNSGRYYCFTKPG